MNFLILISHGRLAEGMKAALEMFSGDAADQSFALCLHEGESAEVFKKNTIDFLSKHAFGEKDKFVILADVIGGSPLTIFLDEFASRKFLPRSIIFGGMNFSMALAIIVNLNLNTLNKDEFIDTVLKEGRTAIKQYEIAQNADEDDI